MVAPDSRARSDPAAGITVLAGGVGAARFLAGLVRRADPVSVTAICNVGDDFEWHGLHISPDIDTILYTLAGVEGDLGWGIRGDSFTTLEALHALGGEAWFRIGDRDMATHLLRTSLLREGRSLAEATAELARRRGIDVRLLPVTSDPHPTIIVTDEGEQPFQVYFVQHRTEDEVRAVRFPGAAAATPAPGVLAAIGAARVVVIAPSNPIVSIEPVLAVPGVRSALEVAPGVRAAISPIVAGEAVKGPAARMLASLGAEVSALGVARRYRGLIDAFVLDEQDAALAPAVEQLGMKAVVTDTMMTDHERAARLAATVLDACDA